MAEAAEQAGGEAPQAAAGEPEKKRQETVKKEPGTGGGREMAGKGAETGSIQEGTEAENALPQKKVHMIENPLPLPKKHVKRTLDYSREVPEGKYDFDLEVDEKDDFDI